MTLKEIYKIIDKANLMLEMHIPSQDVDGFDLENEEQKKWAKELMAHYGKEQEQIYEYFYYIIDKKTRDYDFLGKVDHIDERSLN